MLLYSPSFALHGSPFCLFLPIDVKSVAQTTAIRTGRDEIDPDDDDPSKYLSSYDFTWIRPIGHVDELQGTVHDGLYYELRENAGGFDQYDPGRCRCVLSELQLHGGLD